jgi:hypothetical protein
MDISYYGELLQVLNPTAVPYKQLLRLVSDRLSMAKLSKLIYIMV